jgi:hypothetical protein
MARPHPKVAWLGWQRGESVLAPDLGGAVSGTLRLDGYQVALQHLDGSAGQVLRWHRLTFMDTGIGGILIRIKQRSWRYHDQITGSWRNGRVEEENLNPHTVDGSPTPAGQPSTAGPLFFEPGKHGPRLRYSEAELPRYGFPIGHLAEDPAPAGDWYAVAGVSHDGTRPGGLWLELAPGQVVEVIGELITWSSGGASLSLGQLAWEHFAAGDEIALRVAPHELSTVDRVELHGWRRGPRSAFGPGRVLLPVDAHDPDSGTIRLGAGAFTLAYPAAEPPSAGACWLSPDNELTSDNDPAPRGGDTVLVGPGPDGKLVVLGAARYEARLDRQRTQLWDGDPLRELLFGRNSTRPRPDALRRLISTAGGAIAATVEGRSETSDGMVAYFSFRHQQAEIKPGQLAIAQPLGLLGDSHLLVRLGRGLTLLPMREVVSGAPFETFPELATALADSSTWIWVHGETNGEIRTGLTMRWPRQGHFQAELAIGPAEGGTGPVGLVARSVDTQRLYWCPADHLAHTSLSLTEIEALWITGKAPHARRPFRASLIGESRFDRRASLVDSSEALAEVKRLRPGYQLRVTLRKKTAESDTEHIYLAESYATKVAMRCRVRAGTKLHPGALLHVEVDEHRPSTPRMITVVPAGERRYALDLPSCVVSDLRAPLHRRAAFDSFLRWRAEAHAQAPDPAELVQLVNGPELDRLLCRAYQASLDYVPSPAAARAALRWLRAEDESVEVDLPYPVMALATLAAAIQQGRQPLMEQAEALDETEADALLRAWDNELSSGMARLAKRALRSIHVEVLTRRWIQRRPGDSSQIWQRISRLEKELTPEMPESKISEILQFAHAAELAGDWEGYRIADGLRAALGRLEGIERIYDDAPILTRILGLCRMQTPNFEPGRWQTNGFSAAQFQLPWLRQIIEEITVDGVDITLLPSTFPFYFAKDSWS